MTSSVSRRRALAGAASLGVGVPLLAACGDDGSAAVPDPETSPASSTPPAPATPSGSASPSGSAGSARSAAGLVAAGDVPVGGGVVLKQQELVVTQPTEGEFKAFSALCTHQGCLVGSVADGAIHCPCHNSVFSASDGSVEGGPANGPLPEVAVMVVDGQVQRS